MVVGGPRKRASSILTFAQAETPTTAEVNVDRIINSKESLILDDEYFH